MPEEALKSTSTGQFDFRRKSYRPRVDTARSEDIPLFLQSEMVFPFLSHGVVSMLEKTDYGGLRVLSLGFRS